MELRDKNGLTEQEYLAAYRPKNYDRPSLTADIAVFSVTETETKLLLIRRGNHPFLGKWALPGGFANRQEAVEDTASRELEEETGLTGLNLIPVGLFSKPGRDPRTWVVSQAFSAVIPESRLEEAQAGDDAADARWFTIRTERAGRRTCLCFESGHTAFQVLLQWNAQGRPEALESGGLAFDHSEIIGCAMKQTGLL